MLLYVRRRYRVPYAKENAMKMYLKTVLQNQRLLALMGRQFTKRFFMKQFTRAYDVNKTLVPINKGSCLIRYLG